MKLRVSQNIFQAAEIHFEVASASFLVLASGSLAQGGSLDDATNSQVL